MSVEQRAMLQRLHNEVVDAARRWQISQFGSKEKRQLELNYLQAESKFTDYLIGCTDATR